MGFMDRWRHSSFMPTIFWLGILTIALVAPNIGYIKRGLHGIWIAYQLQEELQHHTIDKLPHMIHYRFLNHKIYIPHEDIRYLAEDALFSPRHSHAHEGKIYFWLPFRLRLPFIGEKVFEWQFQLKTLQVKP